MACCGAGLCPAGRAKPRHHIVWEYISTAQQFVHLGVRHGTIERAVSPRSLEFLRQSPQQPEGRTHGPGPPTPTSHAKLLEFRNRWRSQPGENVEWAFHGFG